MSADPRTDPPTPDPLRRILERVARAEQLPQTYTVPPTDRSQPGVRLNDDGSVYREHYYRATSFGQDDVDFATAALRAALPSAPDQRLRELTDFIDGVISVTPHLDGSDYAAGASEGIHTALRTMREKVAALSEGTTSPEAITDRCSACSGDGWTIDADPLPSGEPGAPYQVQCSDCGGSGLIVVGEVNPEPTLDVEEAYRTLRRAGLGERQARDITVDMLAAAVTGERHDLDDDRLAPEQRARVAVLAARLDVPSGEPQ